MEAAQNPSTEKQRQKTLLITVGIDPFDKLIEQIDNKNFYQVLIDSKFDTVIYQIGQKAQYIPSKFKETGIQSQLNVKIYFKQFDDEEYVFEDDIIIATTSIGFLFVQNQKKLNVIVVLDKPDNYLHKQIFYHLIMAPKVIGIQNYKAINFTMIKEYLSLKQQIQDVINGSYKIPGSQQFPAEQQQKLLQVFKDTPQIKNYIKQFAEGMNGNKEENKEGNQPGNLIIRKEKKYLHFINLALDQEGLQKYILQNNKLLQDLEAKMKQNPTIKQILNDKYPSNPQQDLKSLIDSEMQQYILDENDNQFMVKVNDDSQALSVQEINFSKQQTNKQISNSFELEYKEIKNNQNKNGNQQLQNLHNPEKQFNNGFDNNDFESASNQNSMPDKEKQEEDQINKEIDELLNDQPDGIDEDLLNTQYQQTDENNEVFINERFLLFQKEVSDLKPYDQNTKYKDHLKQFKRIYNLNQKDSDPVQTCQIFNPKQMQEVKIKLLEKKNQNIVNFSLSDKTQIVKLITDVYKKKMIEEQYLRCDCPACERMLLPFLLRNDFLSVDPNIQEDTFIKHKKYFDQLLKTLNLDKNTNQIIYNMAIQEVPIQEINIEQVLQKDTQQNKSCQETEQEQIKSQAQNLNNQNQEINKPNESNKKLSTSQDKDKESLKENNPESKNDRQQIQEAIIEENINSQEKLSKQLNN